LTFFQIALRLLILVVSISVIQEICNNNPVLDVVNVPEEFQRQGYTPDVVARRVKDQITEIDAKEKVIERQRLLQLATDSPLPDLQIPTANISLKTTILFVRQLLRFPPDRIMVDVMLDYPTGDKESTGVKTKGPDSRKAQLRVVVRRVPGGGYSSTVEPFSTLNPEDVVRPIAQDVMDEADPYVLGVYVLDSNGPKDSEPHFKKATELDPKDARAFFAWGTALNDQGKLDEAIAKYQMATDLDPKYADAYNNWGAALGAQGKRDEAIAKYQKAIDLDPKHVTAYENWGSELYYQGKFDGAIAKFRKAIDVNPWHTDAEAYSNWGAALARQGKLDEAIAKYRKAIRCNPWYADAYSNWGAALAEQGKRDEAIAKFRKAVELVPQNKLFRSNLEEALRAKRSHK